MNMNTDIFISYKATDGGVPTQDAAMAETLYRALIAKGYRVFFSKESIPNGGSADFHREIDAALDEAKLLILVASRVEYANSRWVEYEWKSFNSDILSNLKSDGQLITFTDGVDTRELPRVLRYAQNFSLSGLSSLLTFVDSVFHPKSEAHSYVLSEVAQACDQTRDFTFYNSAWKGEYDILKIRSLRGYAMDIKAIEACKAHIKKEHYTVLVVGCAYGHVAQTRFGLDDEIETVICIDNNREVLERAKELYSNYPHMKFYEVDVEREDYLCKMNEIFSELDISGVDMIFSTELLRYLNNPGAFIRNSRKLLNKSGLFLIREGDDENKMAYPDPDNLLQRVISHSKAIQGMPNYNIGRELPLCLVIMDFQYLIYFRICRVRLVALLKKKKIFSKQVSPVEKHSQKTLWLR